MKYFHLVLGSQFLVSTRMSRFGRRGRDRSAIVRKKNFKISKKTPNFLRYKRYYAFLEFYALGDNFIQASLVFPTGFGEFNANRKKSTIEDDVLEEEVGM